ncbi:MAG: hypothetical protein HXS53_02230 [Theionarchaea archaeon]|nr:hypothetical protein [Theionarchaea archaeon]
MNSLDALLEAADHDQDNPDELLHEGMWYPFNKSIFSSTHSTHLFPIDGRHDEETRGIMLLPHAWDLIAGRCLSGIPLSFHGFRT